MPFGHSLIRGICPPKPEKMGIKVRKHQYTKMTKKMTNLLNVVRLLILKVNVLSPCLVDPAVLLPLARKMAEDARERP